MRCRAAAVLRLALLPFLQGERPCLALLPPLQGGESDPLARHCRADRSHARRAAPARTGCGGDGLRLGACTGSLQLTGTASPPTPPLEGEAYGATVLYGKGFYRRPSTPRQ